MSASDVVVMESHQLFSGILYPSLSFSLRRHKKKLVSCTVNPTKQPKYPRETKILFLSHCRGEGRGGSKQCVSIFWFKCSVYPPPQTLALSHSFPKTVFLQSF